MSNPLEEGMENDEVPNGKENNQKENDSSQILLKLQIGSVGLGNGDPFVVRVKRKTKWSKVFNAFSAQYGVNAKSFRFSFDGMPIRWENKEKIGLILDDLDNDDIINGIDIDVHAEAVGGK